MEVGEWVGGRTEDRLNESNGHLSLNDDRLTDDAALWRFLSLQETRLSGFRSPMEFFDFNRLSRPADLSTAVSVSLAPFGLRLA